MNATTAARMREAGRWDAKYHALATEHAELAEDLHALFSAAELVELAEAMPFDGAAAGAMRMTLKAPDRAQWLATLRGPWDSEGKRHKFAAVYVAAAAQHLASKVLTEVLELRKQEKAKLEALLATLDAARRSPKLVAAMQRKD